MSNVEPSSGLVFFVSVFVRTKNRQRAILPLNDHVCQGVGHWLPKRGGFAMPAGTASLFPGSWPRKRLGGKILKRDRKRFEIPSVAGHGWVCWVGLRGQFPWLAASPVISGSVSLCFIKDTPNPQTHLLPI